MAPVPGDSSKTPVWHVDAARGPSTPSFDHLVGGGEQRRRNFQAERLGGLKIDHKLKLVRLHYWQVSGFGALKDFSGVYAHLAIRLNEAGGVAHQAAVDGKLAPKVD